MLARGLHVVEGPQQAAPAVYGSAAAKMVRSGRHLDARIAGVHASQADASLELPADRRASLGVRVCLTDCVAQCGPGRPQSRVCDGQFGHRDRRVGQLAPPRGPAFTRLARHLVDGAPGDAERDGDEGWQQRRVDGQPP